MSGYDLKRACADCPFRRVGGIRLLPARVEEITELVTVGRGEFPCHKTTVSETDDEGVSERIATKNSQVCKGGLAFAYKQGEISQMTRIAERLGMIDPTWAKNPDPDDEIFGDVNEMLEQALSLRRTKKHAR